MVLVNNPFKSRVVFFFFALEICFKDKPVHADETSGLNIR